jgi:AP-1 complex subunit gamma-1
MSMKLRDLIRKVRACKTAAEERAVIAKESAMIRTAIREEQEHYRHRNVAKLLFMHMLGEFYRLDAFRKKSSSVVLVAKWPFFVFTTFFNTTFSSFLCSQFSYSIIIHLGYPTHFGQLECLKLIASPHFPEKRIGYLGMMLLLSEQADVLMLATNSLKNDLNAKNKFVAGLALCTIGNLATSDMSRDLAPEVDKHLKAPTPYLRKKACLAMARCLTKCPDMVDDFVDRVVTLLKDKSHGVLITVVQLMTVVLLVDVQNAEEEGIEDITETPCRVAFLRLVPALVKLLRNLLSMGYSPEHEVGGISDPFLQVQILTVLRLLGTNNEEASEEMNDVLAQVATNTETSKNAGNAILYECVQTIMATESEDSLRVLAVNILGRFLLNRDNNIRYVALNTLARCVEEQKHSGGSVLVASGENANSAASALQRHRTTVVDCLKDPDISIRQRALELIYHLVNQENVEDLTAELLNYLVLCPREHRADICARVLRVVDTYSPDDRWRVDTLITMLTIAGRETSTDVQYATIVYISRSSEDIQAYATHKLLKAIRDDDGTQLGLLEVGIWCIGEFGDFLLSPYSYEIPAKLDEPSSTVSFMQLDAAIVVDTVEAVTKRHSCPQTVKERSLTCFAKLSDRYADKADPATLARLHELIKKNQDSHSLELQLRSCEYDALLNAAKGISTPAGGNKDDDIFGVTTEPGVVSAQVISAAKEALARMPVVDLKVLQRKQAAAHFGEIGVGVVPRTNGTANGAAAKGGDLLDLEDIFSSGAPAAAPIVAAETQNGSSAPAAQTAKSDVDLLADIFSASAPLSQAAAPPSTSMGGVDLFAAPAPSQPGAPAVINPMDLFGSPPPPAPAASVPLSADLFGSSIMPQQTMSAPAPAPASQGDGPVTVPGFSHGGLTVEFECAKPDIWNKQNTALTAKFKNTTDAPMYGLSFQCAVPKYVTMEMQPPTSTTIPVTGGNSKPVTQSINVTNTQLGTKNLMLKIKVGFTSKGTKIEHMATCNSFPPGKY